MIERTPLLNFHSFIRLFFQVLRLSVDDISLQFYCDGQTSKTYECAVNIGDLQLDNQLYSGGFYDFPVILAKEDPTKNVQSALNILCKLSPSSLAPENVHISLAPISCFVEDTLAFHLLKLVDTFLAPALLVIPTTTQDQPAGSYRQCNITRNYRGKMS